MIFTPNSLLNPRVRMKYRHKNKWWLFYRLFCQMTNAFFLLFFALFFFFFFFFFCFLSQSERIRLHNSFLVIRSPITSNGKLPKDGDADDLSRDKSYSSKLSDLSIRNNPTRSEGRISFRTFYKTISLNPAFSTLQT